MRYVDRSAVSVPEYFSSPDARSACNELLNFLRIDRERMIQSRAPVFDGAIQDTSVRSRLNEIFAGKCSFCEQARTDLRCHRFRPFANAQPAKAGDPLTHVYYAWLADAWENLYFICSDCMPEKTEHFPVVKERAPIPDGVAATEAYLDDKVWPPDYPPKEQPLLLDPCRDKDIGNHLAFRSDGAVVGKTNRGKETIDAFHLNRKDLLARRRDAFKSRLSALSAVLSGRGKRRAPDIAAKGSPAFDFADAEFSGGWTLLLLALAEEITPSGSVARTPERLFAFFNRMAREKDAADKLKNAIEAFSRVPARRKAPTAQSERAQDTPSARLVSATVTNFKALESLVLKMPVAKALDGTNVVATATSERPVPSLLILGENAAGKSSILEALALGLMDDAMRGRLKLEAKRQILDPTYMGAKKETAVREATVEVRFEGAPARTLTIRTDGFKADSNGNLPPVFAYGAFRHFIEDKAVHRPETAIVTLFKPDKLLANPEKWLLGLKEPQFREVIRALRFILSIEGDFEIIERDMENKRCLIVQKADDKGKLAKSPLRSVSSGYRAVFAMACDIFRGLMKNNTKPGSLETARAIVLIDEVEAHLHPRWKMQIMRGLRRALPNVTFIATTHDPLCLRGMDDGEVMVLQRVPTTRNGGKLPVMVEALTELPVVSKLTVEQLLTSDLFSLFSTDKPELETELARIADILAGDPKDRKAGEVEALGRFQEDIVESLPVGNTEVHRLVQEAVVAYLKERRQATAERLNSLKKTTKRKILAALRGA